MPSQEKSIFDRDDPSTGHVVMSTAKEAERSS